MQKTLLISSKKKKRSSVWKPPITAIIEVISKKKERKVFRPETHNYLLWVLLEKLQILCGTPDIVSRHTGCVALRSSTVYQILLQNIYIVYIAASVLIGKCLHSLA